MMAVDINLDHDLYAQFLSLEKDLNATQGTYKEVKSFLIRLAGIQKIAKKALAERLLSRRTVSIIHSVVLAGSAVAMFAARAEKAEGTREGSENAKAEGSRAMVVEKAGRSWSTRRMMSQWWAAPQCKASEKAA